MKPIAGKTYGSIGHLRGSHMSHGDHRMEPGQSRIMTDVSRHNDVIVVTEKYDGSCVGVTRINGKLVPLTRKGYRAESSPYYQHQVFDLWVQGNEFLFRYLKEGERIVGEWMMQVHSIPYQIHPSYHDQPIVWFDYFKEGSKRHPYEVYEEFAKTSGLNRPRYYHVGSAIRPEDIFKAKGSRHLDFPFSHGDSRFTPKFDEPEGLVYRCVTDGETNFLGKWVREDFEPGVLMEQEIYNLELRQILS